MKTTKQQKNDSVEFLKKTFGGENPPELQCFFKHVSNSGMMRVWDYYFIQNGEMMKINYYIAHGLGYNLHKMGVRHDGCGYSAPCDVAYAISYKLGHKTCVIKYREH